MKHFKNLLILFLISILIISVGAVSAADDSGTSDNVINAEASTELNAIDDSPSIEDSNQDDVLSVNEENDELEESGDSTPLKATVTVSGNTFKDIQNAIDNADYGDTIRLNGTYYGSGSEITIDYGQKVSLVGNGKTTLDAKGLSRILTISQSGVVIKNINFINGNASVDFDGGAVYWRGSDGLLENCSFINNSAFSNEESAYGGAVYWSGENGILNNCSFINNSAISNGYDIWEGEIDYYSTLGGAVYWSWGGDNGLINNSKFANNKATSGSDIYWNWETSGTVANSYFATYNSSSIYGKQLNAINITQGTYTNTLTDLKKLIAQSSNEITLKDDYYYVWGDNKSSILINKNLTINGNGHIIDGMNVSNIFNLKKGCSLTINNTIFKQSICVIESKGIVNISNSQFIGSGITYEKGEDNIEAGTSIISLNKLYLNNCNFSAGFNDIFANGSGSIKNCIFKDNDGFLALYSRRSDLTCLDLYGKISLLNSEFSNIKIPLIYAGNNVSIKNCTFHDNDIWDENLISLFDNSSILNSKFINNAIYCEYEGGHSQYSTVSAYGKNSILNCTFTNCSSIGSGGAIYVAPQDDVKSEDEFNWNNVLIKNCSFINCSSDLSGGAIAVISCRGSDGKYFYSNLTIENCRFVENTAKSNGGALFISKGDNDIVAICTLKNSTFLDNQANSHGDDIYNEGNLSLSKNTLTNDFATIYNAYYNSKAIITSTVSLIVLDNGTKKPSIDNPFTVYAKLTDDNGNLIEDNRISLTIGSSKKTVLYNNLNSLFESTLNSLSSLDEETIVSGAYNGANKLTVKTGVISLKPDIINATIDLDYLNGNVIISLKDLNGNALSSKNVSVFINNVEKILKTSTKGEAKVNVTEDSIIKAIYKDSNGLNVSSSLVVKVIKEPASANASISFVPGNGSVKVVLKNLNGKALSNKDVNVTLNGVSNIMRTGSAGEINVLVSGNYSIVAVYTDNLGASVSASLINVLTPVAPSLTSSINASAMTTVARTTKNLALTLKDANGAVLANKKVKVSVNGKTTTVTTNANGKAYVKTNFTAAGTYYYSLCFLGDDEHKACFKTVKVTVSKQATKAVFAKKTFKVKATKKISFTLKDAKGKPIAKKKITFTINKKTYTATTNSKGIATVTIKITKKGKYLATAKFAGDKAYKAITKKAYITIK